VSVQEILYPRCILGHKIAGFRASEGSSKKHECLSQEYYYVNYGYKNYEAIVNTPEQTIVACNLKKSCFPSKINERKKHWC